MLPSIRSVSKGKTSIQLTKPSTPPVCVLLFHYVIWNDFLGKLKTEKSILHPRLAVCVYDMWLVACLWPLACCYFWYSVRLIFSTLKTNFWLGVFLSNWRFRKNNIYFSSCVSYTATITVFSVIVLSWNMCNLKTIISLQARWYLSTVTIFDIIRISFLFICFIKASLPAPSSIFLTCYVLCILYLDFLICQTVFSHKLIQSSCSTIILLIYPPSNVITTSNTPTPYISF